MILSEERERGRDGGVEEVGFGDEREIEREERDERKKMKSD